MLMTFSTAVSVCTKQDVCQFYWSYFVRLITFPMFLLGLRYFLSVNCHSFNVSFLSVRFFSLGSWKLVNADLPFQALFLKLGIHCFSKPLTGCFLSELSIASKV